MIRSRYSRNVVLKVRYLVDNPVFRVDACQVKRGERFHLRSERLQIVGVLRGRLTVGEDESKFLLQAGQFALVPAGLGRVTMLAQRRSSSFTCKAGDVQAIARVSGRNAALRGKEDCGMLQMGMEPGSPVSTKRSCLLN